jgi:hypothetical protein
MHKIFQQLVLSSEIPKILILFYMHLLNRLMRRTWAWSVCFGYWCRLSIKHLQRIVIFL